MLAYKGACSAEQLKMIKEYESSLLCYSYLSKHQEFTEEQIEEMAVITSPLFPLMDFSILDKNSMKTAIRLLQAGPNSEVQKKEIIQILLESDKEKGLSKSYQKFLFRLEEMSNKNNAIPRQGITDRFDWRELTKYQTLSPEFCERWKECIKRQDTNPNGYTKPYCTTSVVQARPLKARKRGKK